MHYEDTPSIHKNPSILERCALCVLACVVITVLIALLNNLEGIRRYIRIERM